MGNDFYYVIKWWLYLLSIGLLFLPLSLPLFNRFFDRGYIFSKILGIALFSYAIFIFGTLHLISLNTYSLFLILAAIAFIDALIAWRIKFRITVKDIVIILFQEILFLLSLLLWSYIKSYQPDIHGLEKYMDFGFINSILRSTYFPPVDIWFPPFSINYYYFGHLTTAVLTKLTNIPSFITFNLMLATIFAFTVTSAFSIVSTLTHEVLKLRKTAFLSGILAGAVTSLSGNLHTIYTFFTQYTPPENPVPPWLLKFSPQTFPNSYWYPNATRFIPFTIHEFPSYSFVVSDLHGHVLDIPFVFLTLGLILSMFLAKKITVMHSIIVAFMLAVMYMTNAWDGIIYFGLFIMSVILIKSDLLKVNNKNFKWINTFKGINNKSKYLIQVVKYIFITGIFYVIFSLPFNLNFKPFVSGIGVICPPQFLINIGKIGPFIFEADHCQRTPLWMLIILYGFFYFFVAALIFKILKLTKTPQGMLFVLLIILLSTLLIVAPEFIYAKDIYPAHYRANTMFKLGYQAFIMLSIVSSFTIAYLLHKGRRIIWMPMILILLAIVMMYPYFAVISYFDGLKNYKGLNGINYLKTIHPSDFDAIEWMQKNIKGQPIILEAQGDSYTDYQRISANTGIPTPLGWTVHEWLWRGDYSFPQSRIDDIKNLYEADLDLTQKLIKKYNISYIYVGGLEREKYPNLNEEKFKKIGIVAFQNPEVTIYKLK